MFNHEGKHWHPPGAEDGGLEEGAQCLRNSAWECGVGRMGLVSSEYFQDPSLKKNYVRVHTQTDMEG